MQFYLLNLSNNQKQTKKPLGFDPPGGGGGVGWGGEGFFLGGAEIL